MPRVHLNLFDLSELSLFDAGLTEPKKTGIKDSAARAPSGNKTVQLKSIPKSGVWPVVRAWSKPRPTETYTKLPGIIPIKVAVRN